MFIVIIIRSSKKVKCQAAMYAMGLQPTRKEGMKYCIQNAPKSGELAVQKFNTHALCIHTKDFECAARTYRYEHLIGTLYVRTYMYGFWLHFSQIFIFYPADSVLVRITLARGVVKRCKNMHFSWRRKKIANTGSGCCSRSRLVFFICTSGTKTIHSIQP